MNAFPPTTGPHFGPFRFDATNQCLRRGRQRLPLRPKTFAVLRTLLRRAGQLVTREELLDAVWPDTYVSDAVLRFCIRDARKTLHDALASPSFIEGAPARVSIYRPRAAPPERQKNRAGCSGAGSAPGSPRGSRQRAAPYER